MTDPRAYLDQAQARANAATGGPWEAHDGCIISAMTGPGGCGGCSGLPSPAHEPSCYWSDIAGASEPDAEFIALMREAGPRMAEALTAVLDLHESDGHRINAACVECSGDEHFSLYPCPTVKAITEALGEEP